MIRRLIVAIVLSLGAWCGGTLRPAMAALPGPDAESVRNARDAAIYATRASLVPDPELLELLLRVQRDTGALYFALLGGFPEGASRDEQLRAAWYHLDRLVDEVTPTALTAVSDARRRRPSPALAMAAAYLQWTQEHLRRVDRTLPYADPTPQGLLPGQTLPAVIGPHGHYGLAVAQGFWSTHYFRDLVQDGFVPLLRDPARAHKRALFREALRGYVAGVEMQYRAAGRVAALEATSDQFCSVLEAARLLTDAAGTPRPGVPDQFSSLLIIWGRIVSDEPAVQRSLQVLGDSWRRTDATVWAIFRFEGAAQKARCQ